jgi:hypothetical protein
MTAFREVDPEPFAAALRDALARRSEAELLLGKVSEEGDFVWSGCPRWMFDPKRRGTRPTVDAMIEDLFECEGQERGRADQGADPGD